MQSRARGGAALLEANRRFYDPLWKDARLVHRRERAAWRYNRVLMPLGVRFRKKLALAPGLLDTEFIDEVLLVCRKRGPVATVPAYNG